MKRIILAALLTVTGYANAQDVDETCALYLCMFSGSIMYTNDTCRAAKEEEMKRRVMNVIEPWNFKHPIEPYPKCMADDSIPGTTQEIVRSYSKIIMQTEVDPEVGVRIEPGECDDPVKLNGTGVAETVGEIKEDECLATVMTYNLFLNGQQVGGLTHVNEETGDTFVTDAETGITVQVK